MSLTLITPPTDFPITSDEVKGWGKYDEISEDDANIQQVIQAATALGEAFTRSAFMPQTWKQTYDYWEDILRISKPPCIAVDSLKYYNSQGVLTTLVENTDYIVYLDDFPARIGSYPNKCWPCVQSGRLNTIELQFQCGYESDDPRLTIIKQALLVQVAYMLENRQESEQQLCLASENLLWPVRDFRL